MFFSFSMSDDQRGLLADEPSHHADHLEPDETAAGLPPDQASPEPANGSATSPTQPAMPTTPEVDSAAATGSRGGAVEAASDSGGGGGGGILKASRSSSHLASETNTTGQPRQSAIRRSLSHHLKRVSIAGDNLHHHERERLLGNNGTIDDGDADGAATAANPVTFQAGRRSTIHTSYGSIYPSMYRKLSTLHRLSFADVVERITLTFENINVYAPLGGGKSGGGSDGKPVLKKGLSASAEANVINMKQKHILRDGL
jgi:hypothetical protein